MAEPVWNTETLREYMLALIQANDVKYAGRFEESQNAVREAFLAQQTAMQTALTAQKLAVDTALQAADRAVLKAETAADKRFDSVNEFRGTLADQQRTYMPRSEVELLMRTINEKIEVMGTTVTSITAQKSGAAGLWVYVMGGVGIVSLVVSVIVNFVK